MVALCDNKLTLRKRHFAVIEKYVWEVKYLLLQKVVIRLELPP